MKKFSTAFLTIAMLITGTISAFGATTATIGSSQKIVQLETSTATATLYEGSESFPLVASATQISNVEGTVTTGRGEVTVSAVNTTATKSFATTLNSANGYSTNGKTAGYEAGNYTIVTTNTATENFGGNIVTTITEQGRNVNLIGNIGSGREIA